jgi:hypothetical protein
VSVDAVDASGKHQLEILHDVFKRRLDTEGVPIAGVGTDRGGRGTVRSNDALALMRSLCKTCAALSTWPSSRDRKCTRGTFAPMHEAILGVVRPDHRSPDYLDPGPTF